MSQRRNPGDLFIIDISNPRNVEKSVQEVAKVKLYNLDDLQLIAEKNKEERQKSAEKASAIVDEEVVLLDRDVKALSVRNVISFLLSHAEEIRQREVAKALSMMQKLNGKDKKVIDDLTLILLKQTFIPIVENLRKAAVNGDKETIETAVKLFGMEDE
jgi:glutamyl-tRNA reductase